jgi:hypothetical protein
MRTVPTVLDSTPTPCFVCGTEEDIGKTGWVWREDGTRDPWAVCRPCAAAHRADRERKEQALLASLA